MSSIYFSTVFSSSYVELKERHTLTEHQLKYVQNLGVDDHSIFNMESNSGLIEFIEANSLHKKMEQQGHLLSVNEKGQILVPFEGVPTSWKKIKEKIRIQEIIVDCNGKLVDTYYTYQGLVVAPDLTGLDIDDMELEELISKAAVVFQKEEAPSKWNNEFVMSIVTQSHSSGPERAKEHAWFYFKHPDGRILSIGLYRTKVILKTQPGRIERVDNYESYRDPRGVRDVCDVRVTKEQWERELKRLLKIAQNGPLPYHQLQASCATFLSKTFNNITETRFFDSSIHLAELVEGLFGRTIKLLPDFILDIIGSTATRDARRAVDINSLAEHEVVQARMSKITPEEKVVIQTQLNQVAISFSNKTIAEQSLIDHPHELRKRGLEIAAFRLEKIQKIRELYRRQLLSIESDLSLDPEKKLALKEAYKTNFEDSRRFVKLDLPPLHWRPPSTIPSEHPNYDAIELNI